MHGIKNDPLIGSEYRLSLLPLLIFSAPLFFFPMACGDTYVDDDAQRESQLYSHYEGTCSFKIYARAGNGTKELTGTATRKSSFQCIPAKSGGCTRDAKRNARIAIQICTKWWKDLPNRRFKSTDFCKDMKISDHSLSWYLAKALRVPSAYKVTSGEYTVGVDIWGGIQCGPANGAYDREWTGTFPLPRPVN